MTQCILIYYLRVVRVRSLFNAQYIMVEYLDYSTDLKMEALCLSEYMVKVKLSLQLATSVRG
jgi:hypothetical protein